MTGQNVYAKLAGKLGYPESESMRKILEILMTYEEARLVDLLPDLEDAKKPEYLIEKLAKQLGIAEKEIEKKLQDLYSRGILQKYQGGYLFAQNYSVIKLFEDVLWNIHEEPCQELKDAWKEFANSEWYRDRAELKIGYELPVQRILPYPKSLANPDELLFDENILEILKKPVKRALVACVCRRMMRACDKPVDVCLQFDNRAQRRILDRDHGNEISYSQVLQVIERAEEAGLVHTVENRRFRDDNGPRALCNCCTCCCIAMTGSKRIGRLHDAIAKSRYEAKVDQELCIGCQTCIERCQFDAIDMVKSEGSKKLKASVREGECFGCGACAITCPEGALALVAVRPAEHIPEKGDRGEPDFM